jgi:alpha-1,6-mannosyltransferase
VVCALAAAIQLAPLAAPVLLSTDVHSYWDYGRMGAIHGGNPYVDKPSRFPQDPAYELMGANWHNTTAAYGPALIGIAEAESKVVGGSARANSRFWKWFAALGVLAVVGIAAVLARNRPLAAAFVGWNPVLALHFAGGGHNDAWMMFFPLAGIALARAGRRELGGAAWVLGIAVKWLPLLLLPLIWARDRRRFGWRGFAIALAVLAVLSTVRWGVHWVDAAKPINSQLQRASSTSVPFQLEERLGIPQRRATQALTVGFVLAYAWLLLQAWGGRARLALTMGLFCLVLSWLPPWYAAWPVSFAAVEEDDRPARVLALALSGWLLLDAIPHGF